MKNFLNPKTLSFCLVLSLLAVSCKKEPPATPQQSHRELILLCGSSFVEPTNKLCAEFTAKTGIEVVTSVAGSEDFLPLVKTGQRGDILVTHDPYLDFVKEAGVLLDSAHVGFVAPVLAVQKGNPKKIKAIEDLTQPGIKIALSDPKFSTCGEMVAELIEKKGIKDGVMKNVENRLTKGHSRLGTFLKTQVVDAVIMWNGVAHTFRESVDIVPAPYEYDSEIKVHIIGLNYSAQPELVKQFIEMAQTRGPEIYAEFGYTK